MQKQRLYLIMVAVFCMFQSGCTAFDIIPWASGMPLEPVILEEPETEPVVAIVHPEPTKEEYTVFVEDIHYRFALYEPAIGLYLGAYILSNPAIDYDIDRFESATGKSHAIYSYYTSIGGDLPVTWLLSCLSQYKTPNIIIKTPKLDASDAEIEACAKEIGAFNMPMFVQLAPVENRFNPDRYKQFFRRAREIFKEYAPNAAIVWTVNAEDAFDCMKFYPGSEYVDWAGISVYQTIAADGSYDHGMMSAFEYFYSSFQKINPIMLTEYAASHQSSRDSIYRTSMAANEISRIYGELPRSFPRVKAVTYMDVNTMTATSSRDMRDNFSLIEQPEILMAYNKAVETSDYLSQIDPRPAGEQKTQLMRSPFAAYAVGEELFISRATVEQDMNVGGAASRLKIKTIDGREYFPASELRAAGPWRTVINAGNKTVTIKH